MQRINEISIKDKNKNVIIRIGTDMYMQVGNEIYPYKVSKIFTHRKIEIQENFSPIEDNSSPELNIKSNKIKKIITLRKNNVWKPIHTDIPEFHVNENYSKSYYLKK